VAYPASPALSVKDRLSLEDRPDTLRTRNDIVVAQLDSRIFGQHLSYVGSYMNQKNKIAGGTLHDLGNLLPGVDFKNSSDSVYENTTHEIRLASDPEPGRAFDYTVGAFYQYRKEDGNFLQDVRLNSGSFGPPTAAPNLAAYDPSYTIRSNSTFPGSLQETSLFGSATLHLDENTELTGGVRHIWSISQRSLSTTLRASNVNIGLPIPCTAIPNAGLQPGSAPGICVIPARAIPGGPPSRTSETPTIYNISLSHHFTRDFLVYADTGTSYRPGPTTIGLQGAIATTTDPRYVSLHEHPAEHTRAYEVGVKSTWLDGRARLNAAVYRQKFSNLPIQVPNVAFFNTTNSSVSSFNFTQSVDALVQGFDIDAAFQITHDWTVGLQGSYADGKIKGSLVPCTIPGATLNATDLVSLCPGGSSSRLPLWNASLQSEYTRPVADNMDGFLRGLFTYYPENKRQEPGLTVDNYGLLNLYAGVRSHDGAWEASIFARNVLNTEKATDISPVEENLTGQLSASYSSLIRPTGYYQTSMTPAREVGINFHYAIGSR
jgi:iron complex outermembrane receptor protein